MKGRRLARLAAIALGAGAGLWLAVRVILPLFLPILLGLGVAALARRPALALRRRTELSSGAAGFFCVLGIYVVTLGIFAGLCRVLCGEAMDFLRKLPALAARLSPIFEKIQTRAYALADKFPDGIGAALRAAVAGFFESGALVGARVYEKLFGFVSGFLAKLPALALGAVTAVLASFMLAGQWDALGRIYARHVPKPVHQKLSAALGHMLRALGAWLRAQGKLMGVTFLILTAGFLILRIEYALLFSLLVTLIDALPVFGTGTVLIPWSMMQFLQGNARCGVGFLLLYAVAALTRQALEPRLLGGQLGLPPIVTLAALYAGWRVMGVAGMIVFPVLAVFCVQVYRSLPAPQKKRGQDD